MRKVPSNGQADVLNRIELLYLDLVPVIRKFPKNQRYTLAEKIDEKYISAVEQFYLGSFEKEKRIQAYIQMRGHLHVLVFLLRVSHRLSFISSPLYEKFSKELIEIGKIISSWLKKGSNEKT